MNSMQEFWAHPQLAARGRWAKIASPAGELDVLKPPLNLAGEEPCMGALPALGEHTRAILAELGFGPAQVERLARDGAI
jgi:crotonobetainyl-CoA:carnitine CoA-transferase CaiB-like acyl-CoA transferase